MTLTTEEYWEIDGTPLNTYAWNITTWGSGRRGVPPLRGNDATVPFRPGEIYVPKLPGSRTITLGMWVIGANEDGSVPPYMRGKFNENWRALQNLMWRTDRPVTLTRRTLRSDGTVWRTIAMAEFAGGLEPDADSPGRARFTVDFKLHDPYFRDYGAAISTGQLGPGNVVVHNPGDDTVRDIAISAPGGSGRTINNERTGLVTTLAGGDLYVETYAFEASDLTTSVKRTKEVTTNLHNGELYWAALAVGDNHMVISGGSVSFFFVPVYL